MINSQFTQYVSGLGGEDVDFHDIKVHQLNYPQPEGKPAKVINAKNNINVPGSSSNLNASSNGVYVDMGKVLLEAAKSGDSDKVQECVKNGAPFITDWLGTSALHVAAKNNYFDTCATLLRSGISKDAKTKVDRTPLHLAAFEGNFEICQLLIQHECSIDPLDMLKMTPLHWAIEKGFDNIAEMLLENGANPYIISKFLKSPYSIAKEKSNDFIVGMIETLPSTEMKPEIRESFVRRREEIPTPEMTNPQKRERIHSYDSPDLKRLKPSINESAKNLTLQLLKEQMSMMSSSDDNMIQSALHSGRKIMLTEAGKRLLNDSNLNKFLKIPLNTTISAGATSSKKSSVSPRSATVTSRRGSSDVLEIYRDGLGIKKIKPELLNIIRSSSELQEVTITQRPKTSPAPSPTQKSSISLSAINVPKVKVLQGQQLKMPSSPDDFRQRAEIDFTPPEVTSRRFSELYSNYQQLKRSFEREQQKSATLHRQVKQLESDFEMFKRQQNEKFDSFLKLLTGHPRMMIGDEDGDLLDEVEEIL